MKKLNISPYKNIILSLLSSKKSNTEKRKLTEEIIKDLDINRYFIEMANLFYTIPEEIKEKNAHIFAFDIYNCIIFHKHYKEIIRDKNGISFYHNYKCYNLHDFMNYIFKNNLFMTLINKKELYRKAFTVASKTVLYTYICDYKQAKCTIEQTIKFNNHIELRYQLKKIFCSKFLSNTKDIYDKIEGQLKEKNISNTIKWDNDLNLSILLQKTDIGLHDSYLTNNSEYKKESDKENIEIFKSDLPVSTRSTKEITTLYDKVDGIRKMQFENDIFRLLPSQAVYFDDLDILLNLYIRKSLLTYNHPSNILSNKNILIAFISIINPEVENDKIKYEEKNLFRQSIFREFQIRTLYEFISLTQHANLTNSFGNNFTFTYRFETTTNYQPIDIQNKDIILFWYNNVEYNVFKNNLVLFCSELFSHSNSFNNIYNFNYILDRYKSLNKYSKYDYCINVYFFWGYKEDSPELVIHLKYVSKKNKVIQVQANQNTQLEPKDQFVIKQLGSKKSGKKVQIKKLPLNIALRIIETILTI